MSDKLSFTFGGQDPATVLDGLGVEFTVLDIENAGLLGKRVITRDRPGADGSHRVGAELGERHIVVHFKIETRSRIEHASLVRLAKAEEALAGLIHRGGLQELVVSFRDGKFYAEADRFEVRNRLANYLSGHITFVCPSPFLWGDDRSAVRGTGNRVTVESNYFVEPVILWETSANSGAPHIDVDGKRLTIDTQVSAGQQIRIDSARKETRIGGVLEVEHIHGVYPQIYDGSTITTSPGGTVQIQYQERWI